MELNLDEQNLIAAYRRLDQDAREELLRFAASLSRSANPGAAEDEPSSGSCKIAREEKRPEIAAEPLCTE